MNRNRATRQGFTLFELVIAMTISIALLGVLTAVISRLLNSSVAGGAHLEAVMELDRLGQQFRRDVHAAASARIEKPDGQAQRLHLNLPDAARVVYEITDVGLGRVESVGDAVRRREAYSLPGMTVLGFSQDPHTPGQWSLLIGRLAHPQQDDRALRVRFSIDASLARDRRVQGART